MRVYTIAGIAQAAGLHPSTIKNYCTEGLLSPERDSSGRRLFDEKDLALIRSIALEKATRWPARRERRQ
ncbi:MAG: MerR family transcriptional regulator [Candidatus Latescibacteria bacterium]|nr:MerR family transcriptional regulator [Candidatus Latescibacterota bacterium]